MLNPLNFKEKESWEVRIIKNSLEFIIYNYKSYEKLKPYTKYAAVIREMFENWCNIEENKETCKNIKEKTNPDIFKKTYNLRFNKNITNFGKFLLNVDEVLGYYQNDPKFSD